MQRALMNGRILHFKNYEKYKFSKRHARRFKPDDDMGNDWVAWYSRRVLAKIYGGDPVRKVYFELDEIGAFGGLFSIAHAFGRPEGYLACNKYTPYTPLAMAEFMHRSGAHGVIDVDRLQSSIKTIERTIEKLLIVGTLEWVESDTLSASEDTMSAKGDAIGEDRKGQERRGEPGKTKKQVFPLDSPYFKLAKLIIEHAASLDGEDVGLNTDQPKEREERVQKSAKDIKLLIETSWKRWDRKKAIRMAVDVWRWLVSRPDKLGFQWKKNIRSGHKFRYHCDSRLLYKSKEGGELLRQYFASPEFQQKQEAEVRKRQAQIQVQEFDDDKKQAEESRKVEAELSALKKKNKKLWAQKIFEIFDLANVKDAESDPVMSKLERVSEAITILSKE